MNDDFYIRIKNAIDRERACVAKIQREAMVEFASTHTPAVYRSIDHLPRFLLDCLVNYQVRHPNICTPTLHLATTSKLTHEAIVSIFGRFPNINIHVGYIDMPCSPDTIFYVDSIQYGDTGVAFWNPLLHCKLELA